MGSSCGEEVKSAEREASEQIERADAQGNADKQRCGKAVAGANASASAREQASRLQRHELEQRAAHHAEWHEEDERVAEEASHEVVPAEATVAVP
eukprot:scaffold73122_cov61-Phaeocystis_antarctica.AAC.4